MAEADCEILLVEDEELVASMQAGVLRRLGAEVTVAADLESAREAARAGDWDGFVVDVALPRGSGLELVQEVRDGGAVAPVLVQSGWGDRELPRQSFWLDAQFVYKPVGREELEPFVERVRRRRVARRSKLSELVGAFAAGHGLSEAEREVLMASMRGLSYRQMAEERGSTVNTIRSQVQSLLRKTGWERLSRVKSAVLAELFDEARVGGAGGAGDGAKPDVE